MVLSQLTGKVGSSGLYSVLGWTAVPQSLLVEVLSPECDYQGRKKKKRYLRSRSGQTKQRDIGKRFYLQGEKPQEEPALALDSSSCTFADVQA